MQEYSQAAIEASLTAQIAYCKFITANDVGATGGHQYGYHIHKDSYKILFDDPGIRGHNKDRYVTIKWQNDFETTSRFIYYGQETRNEYRVTQFGRGFPYIQDDCIGSLLVLCKIDSDYYAAYVLVTEQEIEDYLGYFNLSVINANGIVARPTELPNQEQEFYRSYAAPFAEEFPSTEEVASIAREIYTKVSHRNDIAAVHAPDMILEGWVDTEYKLFKQIEKIRYSKLLTTHFDDIDSFISIANTILNRRKSRAGKSLEHHLARIFDINKLPYSAQEITEGRHKPDFIIPGISQYRDMGYNVEKLIYLGAKTTCKDRWRQVLSEADRTPHKYLFTLQQGISSNQLEEMKTARLTLVVPQNNITTFPHAYQSDLLSLRDFIKFAKNKIL